MEVCTLLSAIPVDNGAMWGVWTLTHAPNARQTGWRSLIVLVKWFWQ